MTTLHVPLESHAYDVTIETGALSRAGALLVEALGEATGRRILLVADAAVAETHAEVVASSLEAAGFEVLPVATHASFGRVHLLARSGDGWLGVPDLDWEGTSAAASCARN